jgi:hypothetical protein
MIPGSVCFKEHLQILLATPLLLIQEIPGLVEARYSHLPVEIRSAFLLRHALEFFVRV